VGDSNNIRKIEEKENDRKKYKKIENNEKDK
jgi:hypothetical protein